jgi:arylsulfatase A-like enzyme
MHVSNSKRPNIVFILIDDMGWRDLSCYGSDFYETPNIDRLFREGMQFTDAYAAAPVCSPTRASILTGKYPANVGVTDYIGGEPHTGVVFDAPYADHLPHSEKSLAASLNEGGYHTWHVGKWHLGGDPYLPQNHGFDVNIGGCHWGKPDNGYFSPWGIESLPEGKKGDYLTDRLTDEAVRLIQENRDGKPFFLNLWYYTVHVPIQAKPEYIKKYQEKAKKMGLDNVRNFEVGENFPTEAHRHMRIIRRIIQSDPIYAAMIEILDENIGRLLQTLEETGELQNTLIIFTSDNGGLSTAEGSPTCNAPLSQGKGWMYDGGVREPLIVWWPDVVKSGSTCRVPVTSPDFYPTLLEAAGLPPAEEQHTDGVSFMPLLQGGKTLDREAIFWHYPHYGNQGGTPGSSVRMGDYKLIEFYEDGRLELYNLKTDIGEEKNLASTHPEITANMHTLLKQWQEKSGAILPKSNPDWNELE